MCERHQGADDVRRLPSRPISHNSSGELALAPWLLDERVGWRAWAAVGFAGTLLIARPGLGVLDAGAPLAVGAGATYGLFLIATRRLAGTAPPLVTLGWTAAVGAL